MLQTPRATWLFRQSNRCNSEVAGSQSEKGNMSYLTLLISNISLQGGFKKRYFVMSSYQSQKEEIKYLEKYFLNKQFEA
jgi:hypothetical protein